MRRFVLYSALLLLLGPLGGGPLQAATYEDGLRALDEGRAEEALAIWTALAEAGDASASYGIGRLYETGTHGVEQDKAKAAQWYRPAARAGVVAAQNNLARLYAEGDGVPRDLTLATELWEKAALSGHPTAQYNLGLLHLRGEGIAKDEAQGAAWVHKAAGAGVPAAAFVMGDLRRYGIGVSQDLGLALGWYLRAAEAGHEPARAEAERLAAQGVLPQPLDASTDLVAAPGPSLAAAAAPMPESAPLETAGMGEGEPKARPAGLRLPPPPRPLQAARAAPASLPKKQEEAASAGLPEPSPPKPADLQAAATAASIVVEPSGRFGLWLASVRDAEAAQRLGGELAARHRGALADSEVAVQRVEVFGLGAVYRLLAGSWTERTEAAEACEALRVEDPAAFCMPLRY